MIKAVLFDADGVVVTPEKIFSQRMHEEYGVPKEDLEDFFHGEFQQCLVGKSDLRDLLRGKIEGWNWRGTIDELMDYWFSNESKTDERVLGIVKQLREKGVKCYLATNQEKYRTEYFRNQMKLGERFDGIFSSAYVGYKKEQPEFFKHVIESLDVKPEEIALWDDSKDHIESARDLGIQAYLYMDFENFKTQMVALVGVSV